MALTVAELRALFTADTDDIDRAQDHIRRDTARTQSVLKTATGTMAGFLGAEIVQTGGRALIGLLKGSADEASDLNETLNKSATIFGRSEAAMERWASTSDRALGLSKQAALESSAGFGDMFQQLGAGEREAAKVSRRIVQMGADFGSFNNLGTEDVLERISAGFRGEFDSLQALIPNINAARVEEEALRQTRKKSADDLTALDKAYATLAILQKDGARAQGDFEKTSDGAANQQKILAAQIENTKAKLGTSLLPVYRDFFQWSNDKVVPTLNDFIDGMQNGTGAGGDFVDILKDIKDVGEGVYEFFESIPGPVKKLGVELALGGYAFSKVTGGVGLARSALTGFVGDLSTADGTMNRSKATLQAFGGAARNAAGAGGVLLLTDSLDEAGTSAGALKAAAGGALSGAALGAFAGPVGAGIGAAIGGLGAATFSLMRDTEDAGDAARVAIGPWSDYQSTLEGVAAATTKATRAKVFDRLESSGLLDATQKLGLSNREAVNAVMGNVEARKKLAAALRDEKNTHRANLSDEVRKALEDETGAIGKARLAELRRAVAIAKNAEELKAAKTALRNFMKEPANKRISITGLEQTLAKIKAINEALGIMSYNLTHLDSKGTTTPGSGGLGSMMGGGPNDRRDGGRGSSRPGDRLMGDYARMTGTRLEVLEQRRTIRDIQRELKERTKDGKLAVRGLDRQILIAQLAEARKELRRLLATEVNQDALDAAKEAKEAAEEAVREAYDQAVDSMVSQLKSTQGIFSTGTTSASQLLRNLITDQATDARWGVLLDQLKDAGLSQSLLDQFDAEGPSAQALALGQSILKTGNISQLNAAAGGLAAQQQALGAATASDSYGALVNVEQLNVEGMSVDEIARRLYFLIQTQS